MVLGVYAALRLGPGSSGRSELVRLWDFALAYWKIKLFHSAAALFQNASFSPSKTAR
jgi:hypothetical protein